MPTKTKAPSTQKPFRFSETDIQRGIFRIPAGTIHPLVFSQVLQRQFHSIYESSAIGFINPFVGVADCYCYYVERNPERKFVREMVKFINEYRTEGGGEFFGAIVCALNVLGYTSKAAHEVAFSMQRAITNWVYEEGNFTDEEREIFYRTVD